MNLTTRTRAARVCAALAVCFLATAANATANVTSLMLESETGDYVGQGQRRFFWANDAGWIAQQQPAGVVSFAVQPPTGLANAWYLYFASPNGAPLTVGTYSGVARYLSQAANQPGLSVFGEARGCSSLTGSFTVLEAVYGAGSQIVSFRATFEQHCEGIMPPLRGEIRYNARVPIEFSSTSIVKGTFGQPLTVAVTAYSLLGGNVTLSALGLPSGATFTYFGNSAAAMTWTPSLANAGSYLVGFRGQNAQGVVDTVYIRVVITPANDDIESALALAGIPNAAALEGSNIGATSQPGEFGSSQRSVWFRFTAASSERLVLNTAGATFTSSLNVYNDITPETGPRLASWCWSPRVTRCRLGATTVGSSWRRQPAACTTSRSTAGMAASSPCSGGARN